MLLAAAGAAGADVLDLGIARDVEGHLEGCVDKALAEGVDVLVTSGQCWERHLGRLYNRIQYQDGKACQYSHSALSTVAML